MNYSQRISEQVTIRNTKLADADGVNQTVRLAFGVPLEEECDDCMDEGALSAQLKRFAEGQFVAVHHHNGLDHIVGTAHTMRVNKPPYAGEWLDTIGSLHIEKHDPNGEWLYGVEMAVRPSYRKQGIGSALYEARFDLVRRLNLKGWYAGGMLMGYNAYRDKLSVADYGQQVLSGDIIDPTVTMQKNRGFELREVIIDYMDEPQAGDSAILIVWENPDYQPIMT